MSYRKLFNYLIAMGIGGLGLFNSSKLEIRYETNSNLELLCQNGMIISSVIIVYFFPATIFQIININSLSALLRNIVSTTHISYTFIPIYLPCLLLLALPNTLWINLIINI